MQASDRSPGGSGTAHRLAHGELSARDAAELSDLKRQIEVSSGFRCDGYKERCLRRRIAVRMRAREVHAYAEYGALLERDPAEYSRLLDAITINVSKFFRNAEVWSLLGRTVIPHLAAIEARQVNLWSAGAAAGEEAYSLAILLLEHADRHGTDVSRFRILATDIDRTTLDAARRGEYADFAMTETPRAVRERWFEGEQRDRIKPEIRRMVEFAELDLMSGDFPENQHLILCRNVVIYFERPVQEAIFRRFGEVLAPGGFLLLGKVEALFGDALRSFQTVASRERLFRRP
jgi:chemotaxis protein methyltransferase CheR